MKEKVLYFIVDSSGGLLESNYLRLVARDKNINIIQVISPFEVDTIVYANIDVKASLKKPVSQYIKYSGLKGSDVIENPLYANFNVFESELNEVNTSHISRYATGEIGISLSFSSRKAPGLAKVNKGTFNLENGLPLTADDGDYYVAESGYYEDVFYYDFNWLGVNWLKGDIAYWFNNKWRKSNYRALGNMSSVDIPVLPSVETMELIVDDEPLIIILAEDVANIENRIGLAEDELESQDSRIEVINGEIEELEGKITEIEETEIPRIDQELLRLENDKVDKSVYNPKISNIEGDILDLETNKADLSYVISKIASDLANYYTKSETYTQAQVNSLISQIPKFKVLKVNELPSSNIDLMAIYVVGDKEYIWLENESRWEMLGTLEVDMADYYDKTESDNRFAKQTTKVNGKSLSDDVTLLAKDILIGEYGDFANNNVEQALGILKGKTDLIVDDGDGTKYLADDGEYKTVVGGVQSDWNESDNTKDSYIKNKPTIPTVPTISTNVETDGGSDVKTVSPKAVKTYVDNKVANTYKPSGSLSPGAISNALLVVGNLGNVYNITGSFTTTADFLEGAGQTHEAGTNIVIVANGGSYKFDVIGGFVDLSGYATESWVEGKGYKTTDNDTKNTAGTTNKGSTKLFLAGAESQGANPQTYSNDKVYIGTDNELYSNGKKVVNTDTISTNIENDKNDNTKTASAKAVYDFIASAITEALGDDY